MFVYELIGKTATNDFAQRSETVRIGLYQRLETAIKKMEELKSSPDFYMDWSDFEIKSVSVE